MKNRDNFTSLGHYGGVSVSYLSWKKRMVGKVKRGFYSLFLK